MDINIVFSFIIHYIKSALCFRQENSGYQHEGGVSVIRAHGLHHSRGQQHRAKHHQHQQQHHQQQQQQYQQQYQQQQYQQQQLQAPQQQQFSQGGHGYVVSSDGYVLSAAGAGVGGVQYNPGGGARLVTSGAYHGSMDSINSQHSNTLSFDSDLSAGKGYLWWLLQLMVLYLCKFILFMLAVSLQTNLRHDNVAR